MNPFDQSFTAHRLSSDGLGFNLIKEVSNVGKKIESGVRSIGRAIDDGVHDVLRTIDKAAVTILDANPITAKSRAELKRFVATDIGKFVIVVIAVVAAVYGIPPTVWQAIGNAMSNAGAYIKETLAETAKILSTSAGKKEVAGTIIKSLAQEQAAKKAHAEYVDYKVRGMEREAADAEAKYIVELEKEMFDKMEAEFLAQTGKTVPAVDMAQKEIMLAGFVYDVPPPNLGDFWRGSYDGSGPPSEVLYRLDVETQEWGAMRREAALEYVSKRQAMSPEQISDIVKGGEAMLATLDTVKTSPEYTAAASHLAAQGKTPVQIDRIWNESNTAKKVVTIATVKGVAPLIERNLLARGMAPDQAEAYAVLESADMAKRINTTNNGGAILLALATAFLLS